MTEHNVQVAGKAYRVTVKPFGASEYFFVELEGPSFVLEMTNGVAPERACDYANIVANTLRAVQRQMR